MAWATAGGRAFGRRYGAPGAAKVPPSYYDPAIDINVAATNRGFQDLFTDYTKDWGEPGTALGGRQGADYTYGRGLVTRNQGQALADALQGFNRGTEDLQSQRDLAGTNFGRSFQDLFTGRERAQQDYQTNLQTLGRNYQRLGNQQTGAARSAGIVSGGALVASQNRRDVNQAIDRQPIDTGFQRYMQDSALQEQRLREDQTRTTQGLDLAGQRLGQDYGTSQDRINQQAGDQLHTLDTGYLRGGEDAATQLQRAFREALQYGLIDANKLRTAQARQLGWRG